MADGKQVTGYSLDDLVVDEAFQPREGPLNVEHVEDMAEVLRNDQGFQLPPVVACRWDDRPHLTQGFHRVEAYRRAGRATIPCQLIDVVRREDAVVNAMSSNKEHMALRRTSADKRRATAGVLKVRPEWADGRVAKEVGVDPKTVAAVRAGLVATREIPESPSRIGCDGKARAVRTSVQKTFDDVPLADDQFAEPEADPVKLHDPKGDDSGDVQTPGMTGVPVAEKSQPERKASEYPPDGRFMPNAPEAEKLTVAFRSMVARMKAITSEMKALLPTPQHPIANRMHLHSEFLPRLGELIDEVVANTPTHTCPSCVGTTSKADGSMCRECNGYGVVAAGDAGLMKRVWANGSGDWYARLVKEADISELTDAKADPIAGGDV